MCYRYNIYAKRKTALVWSEWAKAEEYGKACEHLDRTKELGYDGLLKPSKAVKLLWKLLGNDTVLADKLLDEGFALQDDIVKDTLVKVKMAIRKKQIKVKGQKYVSIDDLYDVMENIIKGIGEDFEDEQDEIRE